MKVLVPQRRDQCLPVHSQQWSISLVVWKCWYGLVRGIKLDALIVLHQAPINDGLDGCANLKSPANHSRIIRITRALCQQSIYFFEL